MNEASISLFWANGSYEVEYNGSFQLVSKELFMNCGTGNFEIGQEVK